jgi:hypothetical protein
MEMSVPANISKLQVREVIYKVTCETPGVLHVASMWLSFLKNR